MIRAVIIFLLSNYSLTFFLAGLIAAAIAVGRSAKPLGAATVVEKLLAWHVFFSVGVGNFYNFVMHAVFGAKSAAFIGWADSPFQFEVGLASLGFAAVGFLAAFRSFDLRLAAVLGPGIFMLGAAAGHIHQMRVAHNYAPGNAGVVFYTDLIIPLFGFLLLWWQRRLAGVRPHPPVSTAGLGSPAR